MAEYLDRNGRPITLGAQAVVVTGTLCKGEIGTVKDIRTSQQDGKPRVRVADGPEGDWDWSAWCRPNEIVVVPPVEKASPR